jgi:hypothetical protein
MTGYVGIAAKVALLIAAAMWMQPDVPSTSRGAEALQASLAIERFTPMDSQLVRWESGAFADSLATRLATIRGLRPTVTNGGRQKKTDYTLGGDVRTTNGRLVISTRLHHAGERLPVWSGTFWRGQNSLDIFVDEVAAAVAEALYADIARRALASTAKERQ